MGGRKEERDGGRNSGVDVTAVDMWRLRTRKIEKRGGRMRAVYVP